MKILVLTKRQYTGYDLLDHHFGRLRELPLGLSRLGHEIVGIALSYRMKNEGVIADGDPMENAPVTWHCVNFTGSFVPRPGRCMRFVTDTAAKFHPDLIWACSDAYHAIFGTVLAARLGVPCVVDLYDNFESFKATWLPGVLHRFKRAVRMADGVTCVSRSLADYIAINYRCKMPILILNNSARTDLFFPRDQSACRQQLRLPAGATIVGTAGAIGKSRGVSTLFRAFELLAKKNSTLNLAFAGPRSRFTSIPKGPKVHDLGTLRFDAVPLLFNALDVAVICNRDSAFGRYCFPQKAYEIIACRVPLVAADVGSIKELLGDYPQCRYEPDNVNNLAESIERQLETPSIVNVPAPSWAESAGKLETFFQSVLRDHRHANMPPGPGVISD